MMMRITTVDELRTAIAQLEEEKRLREKSIRLGIRHKVDSLKPVNLLKTLFGGIAGKVFNSYTNGSGGLLTGGAGGIKSRLLRTAAALGTSFLVRKFFTKKSRQQ